MGTVIQHTQPSLRADRRPLQLTGTRGSTRGSIRGSGGVGALLTAVVLATAVMTPAKSALAYDGSPKDMYRRGTTMLAVGIPMLSVGVAMEPLIGFSPMVRAVHQYPLTYGGPLLGTAGASLALAGAEHQVAALRAVGLDVPRHNVVAGWILFGFAIAAEMAVVAMDTLDEATAWPHYFWVGGVATALKAGALVAVSVQAGINHRFHRREIAPPATGDRRRPTRGPMVTVTPAGAGLAVVAIF